MDKAAETSVPVHPLIARRWSPRAFDPAAEVAEDDLRALLEAARWAASHGNTQPARYLVGRRGDPVFARILGVLRPKNRTWAQHASVLVLGLVRTADERGPLPNTEYGLGLAMQNLVLQAQALGLATHQIGGFDPAAVPAAFALPDDLRPVVVVAIGHRGDPATLPDELRAREERPRTRLPLSELVLDPPLR